MPVSGLVAAAKEKVRTPHDGTRLPIIVGGRVDLPHPGNYYHRDGEPPRTGWCGDRPQSPGILQALNCLCGEFGATLSLLRSPKEYPNVPGLIDILQSIMGGTSASKLESQTLEFKEAKANLKE